MANLKKRVAEDAPGDFFVDSTCIDCDTCRQVAPAVFGEAPGHAFVRRQPETPEDRRRALQALVCCPTGSIGTRGADRPQSVMDDFPLPVEPPVYYCGFTSPKSYGGGSYFVQRPDGNWLIDAPKFLPRLVRRFEALGGIAHIFLTHSDDVADARLYAERFGARRYIHRAELHAQPEAEAVLDGEEPIPLAADFLAIPTPGHTEGHCVLLYRRRFLFTGDHLAWDRDARRLEASEDYCWYSWPRQAESMERLAGFPFEWVLPGHGQRVHLPEGEMRRQVMELAARMRGAPEIGSTGVLAAPVSAGELIDKITILEIKSERIAEAAKTANVRRELEALREVRERGLPAPPGLAAVTEDLKRVNETLWDVEDELRRCESRADFGPHFVELARSVYRHNDRRAALKRQINELLGSALVEEKSYAR